MLAVKQLLQGYQLLGPKDIIVIVVTIELVLDSYLRSMPKLQLVPRVNASATALTPPTRANQVDIKANLEVATQPAAEAAAQPTIEVAAQPTAANQTHVKPAIEAAAQPTTTNQTHVKPAAEAAAQPTAANQTLVKTTTEAAT